MATKAKQTTPQQTKAIGAWGVLSGSKKTNDIVYCAKIWHGQEVETVEGDIVILLNWKGHQALIQLGEYIEEVQADHTKGQMGYDKYEVVLNTNK